MNDLHANIIKHRQSFPCDTMQTIGDRFGITREAVRQVLKANNQPTANASFGTKTRCYVCGEKKHHSANICKKCYMKQSNIPLKCDQCGEIFHKKKHYILYQTKIGGGRFSFCSKRCQGMYIGNHFGFGSDDGRKNINPRKKRR